MFLNKDYNFLLASFAMSSHGHTAIQKEMVLI